MYALHDGSGSGRMAKTVRGDKIGNRLLGSHLDGGRSCQVFIRGEPQPYK
jgi:hypothetical protein